jgi:hypothetical protein
MTAPEVDLNFLAQQLERILTESEMCREDMAALIALTARVEAKMNAALEDMRAVRLD